MFISKKQRILLAFIVMVGSGGIFISNAFAAATQTEEKPMASQIFQSNGNSIMQSNDNGSTWHEFTYADDDHYYSYEEYEKWIENEKKAIKQLVDAGEWTQEQADEAILNYESLLNNIKEGKQVKKRATTEDDFNLSSTPVGQHTEGYETFIYNGNTFEQFGPYDTKDEMLAVIEPFCREQVKSGNMSQQEADEILSKYK